MMIRSSKLRSLLLVLLLGWTTAVSAQQAQNYGFVSPNTRTDLKLQEAITGMNSAEESKLLKQAVNLGCVVRSRIRAFRALGSWSDGAEYSVMLSVNGDEESLRYVLSRLGRDHNRSTSSIFIPNRKAQQIFIRCILVDAREISLRLQMNWNAGVFPFEPSSRPATRPPSTS